MKRGKFKPGDLVYVSLYEDCPIGLIVEVATDEPEIISTNSITMYGRYITKYKVVLDGKVNTFGEFCLELVN